MSQVLLFLLSLAIGVVLGTGVATVTVDPAAEATSGASRDSLADEAEASPDAQREGEFGTSEDFRSAGEIGRGFVPLGRQIIVPVVRGSITKALVLFDLALDLPEARVEAARLLLPRIRDAFLQDLLNLSYTGAFEHTYTEARVLEEIRRRLLSSARSVVGKDVEAVLILDVLRQEI